MLRDQAYRSILLVVFALSGFAGLIYQSIWSHYFGLFLGHAAYSQALVLSLFMGGMALGAGLVSRLGHRWRNLIRVYAIAEALIGVLGIGFHWIFVAFLDVSYDHVMPALPGSDFVSVYKWTTAALLILPQTVLLGMTFPLLAGGLIRRLKGEDGYNLGSLYFANSIGAAFGVLAATFAFLPAVGLPGAMTIGGTLNLLVAAAAWILSRRGQESIPKTTPIAEPERGGPSPVLRIVLIATFLSSAASFAYEILFVRMIGLAVGSTLHAFELMIAAFVLGIALGARWIRKRASSTERPLILAGHLQIWMGIAALVGLALYANAFAWVGFLMDALDRSAEGYSLFNVGTGVISIVIMLPTAFFAGTTLPVYTVALLRSGYGEPSIGRVYAWNTLGAIIGVVATMLWLLPLLGLKLAMLAAALVDIGIGIALFRLSVNRSADFVRVGVAAAASIAAALLVANALELDPHKLSSGVYRSGNSKLGEDAEILYYKDGKTSTVTLFQAGPALSIATNGKVDAGVVMTNQARPAPDEPTMVLLGAIPLAYLPGATDAAVIGMGSGITTHTVLGSPGIERVDTIEIEQAMVDAARGFGERSIRVYEDPRSNIVIDDAKSYFSSSQRRYDLIISEPSNPWMSGVANLFSKEFYARIPASLEPNGVFIQWLQLYEIDTRLVVSALQGLLGEFEHVHAYLANPADLILVASQQPLAQPDFDGLFAIDTGNELKRIRIDDPRQIRYRRVADRDLLQAIVRANPAPTNSDYHPVLALEAPRARFEGAEAIWLTNLAEWNTDLLKWLDIRLPVSDPAWLSPQSHFPGEVAASRAADIRAALLELDSQSVAELPPEDRNLVFNIRSSAAALCTANPSDQELAVAFETLAELARRTLPFLASPLLEDVLIEPEWLPCEPDHKHVREALALLAAAARRQEVEMTNRARTWLSAEPDRPEYTRTLDPLALSTLTLGLIGQGDFEAVGIAEEQFGKTVPIKDDAGMERVLFSAWLEQPSQD
ncbi:MAG: hypothetical protein RQ741_11940 [Wenzhouxiangellaceae bacterium]|nr:hypothetical protein [Wenzhouxiangellaceae bacterium]